MMKKQTFFPKAGDMGPHNTFALSKLGLNEPDGTVRRRGRYWMKHQISRQDTFLLNVVDSYSGDEHIGYTKQEDYIKINFWLSGKHTTVLDGFGEHEHDRPEVFITAGPWDMTKVDLTGRDTRTASVSLCLRRDFFPVNMGLNPEELPEPLRAIVVPEPVPYAFHRYSLTPDLIAAARAILAAPFSVRRQPLYAQGKALELMCLLFERIAAERRKPSPATQECGRQASRLYDAREFLARHYTENITLDRISREVGLNKKALTSGFRQLFGMSVYDCVQKERMERAYDLLQDRTNSIAQIAEAVGFGHACNFSTAFHNYFGFAPQKVRGKSR